MKKLFNFPLYLMLMTLFVSGFTSCSDDDVDTSDSEKDAMLSDAVEQYVNKTVIVTYTSLADAADELYEALVTLKANKTAANLNVATQSWFESRAHWELSEAFLFGAVSDFNIDPHIDTWPLDEEAFVKTLADPYKISKMDAEDGDVWAADHLGFALLGFHGIEYILFENGAAKNPANITDDELIYAVAVAGDLRNQCFQLEASWAGIDNVSAGKREKLEELEYPTTLSISNITYGENMLLAAQPGSTYRTVTNAAVTILEGCTTISEEVGDLKIGNAHRGDDVNYIESPYSFNSLTDFVNNIESIRNAYLGGADASKRGASVSDYIQKTDPAADTKVKNAIDNAIAKIRLIPAPFKSNFSTPQAGDAIEACSELTAALNEAKIVLTK
jgi:hypothetical protein